MNLRWSREGLGAWACKCERLAGTNPVAYGLNHTSHGRTLLWATSTASGEAPVRQRRWAACPRALGSTTRRRYSRGVEF